MAFAAENNDTSMQSNDTNASVSPAESTATPTTPSADTNSSSTSSQAPTPPTNEQGSQIGADSPADIKANTNDTNMSNLDVNANVTEANNKVSIQGVTVAPTFTAVEVRDNVYYLPDNVNPIDGFYFLRIDSTDRVCSLQQITKVKILSTPLTITVMAGEQKKTLYCYDRSYFNF
jgi:hypothetical protein